MPATWKTRDSFKAHLPRMMGHSCLKAYLHISVEAEVFISREKGTKQRSRKGDEKFFTCRQALSILIRPVMVQGASSGIHIILTSCHPGGMVKGQKISQS